MTKAGDLYGQSLYDLALSENLTDEVLSEMEIVRELFRENPDYIALLSEPSIPKKERLRLLDEAFGDSLQEYLLNFIKILLEKGLLRQFSACLRRFRSSYYADHGIAEAVVTSAVPLDEKRADALARQLTEVTGKKILMKQKVDAGVLGGIRVEVDGKLFDGTVKGRLSEIRRRFSETVM